jgi:hypothetical protein
MGIPCSPGKDGTYALPATGVDGIVVAQGLCDNQQHYFVFKKTGYRDASAQWAAGGDGVFIDLPPTDPQHTHQGQYVSDRGVVVLPMYPGGS